MIPIQIKCINVEMKAPDILEIEHNCRQAFDRFDRFIRDAQLTFRDANGPKGGVDKQCTIQLRFFPRGLAVTRSNGTSFAQSANFACDKMQQVVAKRLSKKKSVPGRNNQAKLEGLAYGN